MAEKKEVVPAVMEYIDIMPKKNFKAQCNEMILDLKVGIKSSVPKYLEDTLKTEGII